MKQNLDGVTVFSAWYVSAVLLNYFVGTIGQITQTIASKHTYSITVAPGLF